MARAPVQLSRGPVQAVQIGGPSGIHTTTRVAPVPVSQAPRAPSVSQAPRTSTTIPTPGKAPSTISQSGFQVQAPAAPVVTQANVKSFIPSSLAHYVVSTDPKYIDNFQKGSLDKSSYVVANIGSQKVMLQNTEATRAFAQGQSSAPVTEITKTTIGKPLQASIIGSTQTIKKVVTQSSQPISKSIVGLPTTAQQASQQSAPPDTKLVVQSVPSAVGEGSSTTKSLIGGSSEAPKNADQLAAEHYITNDGITWTKEGYPDVKLESTLGQALSSQDSSTKPSSTEDSLGLDELQDDKSLAKRYLDKKYPNHVKDGMNERISSLVGPVLPSLLGLNYNYDDIVEAVKFVDQVSSTGSDDRMADFGSLNTNDERPAPGTPFKDLTPAQKKYYLKRLNQGISDKGLPPAFGVYLSAALVSTIDDPLEKQQMASYVTDGEMKRDLTEGWFPQGRGNIKDYLLTQQNLTIAGAAFGVLGIVGGFMVGGPAGALVAAGTFPFTATEWSNPLSMNTFGSKTNKQSSGEWAPDRQFNYNTLKGDFDQYYNTVSGKWKNLSPEERLKEVKELKSKLKDVKDSLGDEWIYLKSLDTWDSAYKSIDFMNNTIDALSKTTDTKGNLAGELPDESTLHINTPKGATIVYGDGPHGMQGQPVDMKGVPGEHYTFDVVDKDGKVVKTYEGNYPYRKDTPFDIPDLAQLTKAVTPTVGYGVINIKGVNQDTQKLYLDGVRIWGDTSNIQSGKGYHTIIVKEQDKQDYVKQVYVNDDGSMIEISPAMKDVFKPYVAPEKEESDYGGGGGGGGSYGGGEAPAETGYVIFGPTSANCVIVLDDVEISPVLGQMYALSQGYHAVKLTKEGKKPWLKTVYVKNGDTVTVSPVFEDDSSNPSGDSTTSTSKKVDFNSNPSGAKILLDGSWTGQYTPAYLYIAPGLHKITFSKSGVDYPSRILWISSVILEGENALAVARLNGVDTNGF